MSLKETFKLVLGWRLLLVLISIPGMFFLISRPGFTMLTPKPSMANVFSMWSNFDGAHYLNLAEFGYGYQRRTDADYAFFPVYPWATHTFNFFGSYLTSGLFISHLSLIFALYFLYKLVALDFNTKIARSTIYLMLIFPTAFFFGSVYAESLFLLLAVLSFYLARKNNFFLACVTATVASATGISGIFLWPALIYEFWLFCGRDFRQCLTSSALSLALPPLGLLAFLRFQFLKTGTFFLFPVVGKLVLLHQVFFRYSKMLIFTDHLDPLFFTIVLELVCATLILFVLIFSFKKIRFSYWLFVLLSYLLPSFSGSFMSFPRYTIVLFPIFIYLALWLERQHPFVKFAYYALCIVSSVLAITFFTRGYFVG